MVTVSKEALQAADTITTQNILDMSERMYEGGSANAVWLVSRRAKTRLYSLTMPVGAGGGPVGLLREQNVQGVPVDYMLGRPVIETEKCSKLGDLGDIIFVDLSQYLIGNKAGNNPGTFNSSVHFAFSTDETAFKISLRTDGQCWWKSALTPANSDSTVSPVVVLEAR